MELKLRRYLARGREFCISSLQRAPQQKQEKAAPERRLNGKALRRQPKALFLVGVTGLNVKTSIT